MKSWRGSASSLGEITPKRRESQGTSKILSRDDSAGDPVNLIIPQLNIRSSQVNEEVPATLSMDNGTSRPQLGKPEHFSLPVHFEVKGLEGALQKQGVFVSGEGRNASRKVKTQATSKEGWSPSKQTANRTLACVEGTSSTCLLQ